MSNEPAMPRPAEPAVLVLPAHLIEDLRTLCDEVMHDEIESFDSQTSRGVGDDDLTKQEVDRYAELLHKEILSDDEAVELERLLVAACTNSAHLYAVARRLYEVLPPEE